MSQIFLIGANHKTAPIELREMLSFTEEETARALALLKKDSHVLESFLFSTCNRTEVLYIADDETSTDRMIEFISQVKRIEVSTFKQALYIYKNSDAVEHLFEVASSLDSMIVGEPQILGQIKQAYRNAVKQNTSGVILNRLLHKSFSVAKKVRKETGIGDNAVSISYAAIELANKIFSDLASKSVMLLGAGEMAELAVEHLISNDVNKIIVANRTFKNAVELAEKFNGHAIKFEERESALFEVDIIISSTGATDYVIEKSHVKKAMRARKNAPLFFIDIAVPRDIDPKVNKISNAYLYDIDDLKNIVEHNMEQRQQETVKAKRFIEEAVVKFEKWQESLKIVPSIKAINDKISEITRVECEKTLSGMRHLSEEDADAIRRMVKAIVTKTMHDPIRFLKNTGNHRDDSVYLNIARQLFNIDVLEEDE